MAPTIQKNNQAGRMLNEFLVSLGLLFILLVPDVAILSAAVSSSSRAASEDVALDMARNTLESAIADLGSVIPRKSYEADGTTYSQSVRLVPLQGERAGLTIVVVSIEWFKGDRNHQIRLERYVRGS